MQSGKIQYARYITKLWSSSPKSILIFVMMTFQFIFLLINNPSNWHWTRQRYNFRILSAYADKRWVIERCFSLSARLWPLITVTIFFYLRWNCDQFKNCKASLSSESKSTIQPMQFKYQKADFILFPDRLCRLENTGLFLVTFQRETDDDVWLRFTM